MSRIVHFEINADNPERASKFYSSVFGWEFTKWEGPEDYWLIKTGPDDQPGINGGMMKRRDPGAAVFDTIGVANVDDAIRKITGHGGEIVMPKMPVPGVGFLAYFKDTEGNVFGVIQPDMSAK